MNVGEFKSFITIEKDRYSEFNVFFLNSFGYKYTVGEIKSQELITSGGCGNSVEDKFIFIASGGSSSSISANNFLSILDETPDDYEMYFINNAPGILSVPIEVSVENAKLEDLTTSTVGSGTKITGTLTITNVSSIFCSSSSSSSV